MFTEYFREERWREMMPGIRFCAFGRCGSVDKKQNVRPQTGRSCMEILFCTEGTLTLHKKNGTEEQVGAREILLLSGCENLDGIEIGKGTEGMCLSARREEAAESWDSLNRSYGGAALYAEQVQTTMEHGGGFCVLHMTSWNRAAFYALQMLPEEEHGRYCLMKGFELLYLLCLYDAGNRMQTQQRSGGSLSGVAVSIKAYMEDHLDEKLTIADLSQRFHLSPTACKSCFRSCFGQPIHSWLLDKRMERAADLLAHTTMPILEIAEAVGYTGISQFNVAFRQRYAQSPGKFRKMSFSGVF